MMSNKKKPGIGGREIAAAYKLLVVQERLKGTPIEDVAAAFGVSGAAVQKRHATLLRTCQRKIAEVAPNAEVATNRIAVMNSNAS